MRFGWRDSRPGSKYVRVRRGVAIVIIIVIGAFANSVKGQDKNELGNKFYFQWGYNWANYGKSDIKFEGTGYNFTLKKVQAFDRQTPFDPKIYFSPTKFSIPQYVYRLGYYINNRYSISLGMDHMKYVMPSNIEVRIIGEIDKSVSEKYAGSYNNEKIVVSPDFLQFEHTDGLNYLSIEVEVNDPIWMAKSKKQSFSFMIGAGLGTYIPKSNVKLFGHREDNKFHMAGYGASVKVGGKLNFTKSLYLLIETKSGVAKLTDILTDSRDSAKASQFFSFFERYIAIGGSFYIFNKNKASDK